MKLKDLCIALDSKIPEKYYCMDNDKVGLFVGDVDRDIKKVVTVTDSYMDVIDYSIENKADMILCHHPLIFSPVDRITTDDKFQKKLYKLIKNDIAVFSMHTNLDSGPGGLCEIMAKLIGLKNIVPMWTKTIEENGESKTFPNLGRVGDLEKEMTCEEFREMCLEAFQIPYAKCNFNFDQTKKKIKRVCCISGAGGWLLDDACKHNVDAYICGDLMHDDYLKATERDVFLLDIGHYETECTSSIVLANFIKEIDPSIEVVNFEVVRGNKLVKKILGV